MALIWLRAYLRIRMLWSQSRYRGIRLFEFHESNPAGYVTRMLTWVIWWADTPATRCASGSRTLRDRCHQHA